MLYIPPKSPGLAPVPNTHEMSLGYWDSNPTSPTNNATNDKKMRFLK